MYNYPEIKNYFIKVLFFWTFLILKNFQPLDGIAQNLVGNPSFENYTMCPNGTGQINYSVGWLNFGNTPEYFNACATNGMNVPNSSFGYQDAHSGIARSGFVVWRKFPNPGGVNAREFIGTILASPLVIGQQYFFTCFINFSNTPQIAVACNKFGIKLTTYQIDSSQYLGLINNEAHIYSDSIISDSIQWSKISGSFIADSSYNTLVLGNFFEYTFTDTLSIGPFPDFAYYYVDDICLSTDSIYCETWTALNNNLKDLDFKVYPSPAKTELNINFSIPIANLLIRNLLGEVIEHYSDLNNGTIKIDVSNISSGVYFVEIFTENNHLKKIFMKF